MDFFTKYVFEKYRPSGVSEKRGPIMLMYHGTPTTNKTPSSKYGLTARRFFEQISFLYNQGWKTACVRDIDKIDSLSPKTVFITFDDGYKNNFEGAFLPLTNLGFCATWFITTDCIDDHARWMGPERTETRMMNESELKTMASQGMEIGSHTASHPDLATLSYDEQLTEMKLSKQRLEKIIGNPVQSFAYPYGRYNGESLKAVKTCGYKRACSVKPGWVGSERDPFQIRRVTIFNHDNARTLARKLVFADNDVSWSRIGKYYWSRALAKI